MSTVISKSISNNTPEADLPTIEQTIVVQPTKEVPGEVVADLSQPLPTWNTILLLVAVTAVATWALVQIAKSLFQGWMDSKKGEDGKKPWWWAGGLRVLALVAGAGIGTVLYGALGGTGDGWPWGTVIGAGAGSLASIVVMVVKKRIRALGESK